MKKNSRKESITKSKSSKAVQPSGFHIELFQSQLGEDKFINIDGSNINSGSMTSPHNMEPSGTSSPDRVESTQNQSLNYEKGFLNSQA